ncbi:MAG: HU family DNA-binding protein [Candidatus Doudnabacteria bacterium]|nr:HU family DNA-binding protein [Candidatus Doudnabacteria bacterium]
MHKQDVIDALANKLQVTKPEAEKVLDAFVDVVMESLRAGQEVSISGFGVFAVSERHARTGVNPRNPSEKIQIPATKVPKFRAGKGLKDAVR